MNIILLIFFMILLTFYGEIKEYFGVKIDEILNHKKISEFNERYITETEIIKENNKELTKKIARLNEILEQKV